MKRQIISWLILIAMVTTLMACASENTQTPQQESVQIPVAEQDTPDVSQEVEVPAEPVSEDVAVEEPSAEQQPPAEEQVSDVNLVEIRQQILTQLEISDPFLLETDALMNLYGIGADQVKQSGCFVTMAGTFPDEIILVEAVDENAVVSIQHCLQNRLNEVLVQSETYDPDNYAAAQQCQVLVNGLHISLILSPRQAEMTEIYQNMLG